MNDTSNEIIEIIRSDKMVDVNWVETKIVVVIDAFIVVET